MCLLCCVQCICVVIMTNEDLLGPKPCPINTWCRANHLLPCPLPLACDCHGSLLPTILDAVSSCLLDLVEL